MLPNASSQSEITCKTLPSIDGASSTSQLVRTQHRWCQLDQPARRYPASTVPASMVPARPARRAVPDRASSSVLHTPYYLPIRQLDQPPHRASFAKPKVLANVLF